MKKTLSIILCLMILLGTIAVGNEDFAQLFAVKSTANSYQTTLTPKCEVEVEFVSRQEANKWWSFVSVKRPYYHVKLHAWIDGLPIEFSINECVTTEWFLKKKDGNVVLLGNSSNFETYQSPQSGTVIANTFEIGSTNIPDVGNCFSADDIENYEGEFYARMTFGNTDYDFINGLQLNTNKVKFNVAVQTIYAQCFRVRGKQIVNDAGQEEFYEERPNDVTDDPFGFYLPEDQDGTDWFYIVKYFTNSNRSNASRTVVAVDDLWHYRGLAGVAYEIKGNYKYSYYIKEGDADGELSNNGDGSDTWGPNYEVNGRGYDYITYTDGNGKKDQHIRCGTPNWDSSEGYEHYNQIQFTTQYLQATLLAADGTFGASMNLAFSINGDGTQEHPYLISNEAELRAIDDNPSAYYKLINNITLSNTNWSPLCQDGENPFSGELDGNGYSINGLTYSVSGTSYYYFGLFRYVSGTIKDLKISNVNVSFMLSSKYEYINNHQVYHYGSASYGTLVETLLDSGIIENCAISGQVNASSYSESNYLYIGGLVSHANHGTITQCVSDISITIIDYHNHSTIIIGGISATDGIISMCQNKSNFTDTRSETATYQGWTKIGGISGKGYLIENCYNNGNIVLQTNHSATGTYGNNSLSLYVGGICGYLDSDNTIKHCYSSGSIQLDNHIRSYDLVTDYICGINSSNYYKCYDDCYYATSSEIYNNLCEIDTFKDFDFTNIWTFNSEIDYDYPVFKWQSSTTITNIRLVQPLSSPLETVEYCNKTFEAAIEVEYSDGSTETKELSTMWMPDLDLSSIGEQTVHLGYGDYLSETTVTVTVVQKSVDRVDIYQAPSKTTYVISQDIDLSDASIIIYYNNGQDEMMSAENAVAVYDKEAIGEIEVFLKYGEVQSDNSFTVTVTAKAIKSISLIAPSKRNYYYGDELDISDGYIFIVYESDDDYSETVYLTDTTVKGYDPTYCAEQTVTVTYQNYSFTYNVTVLPIQIESIWFSEGSITMENKSQRTVTVNISPANATNKQIIFRSEDDSIATVDQNGLVSAVSVGTTYIIAKTSDGKYTDSCKVVVTPRQFTIKWYADGAQIDETTNNEGESIVTPSSPTKEGYVFVKWNPDIPATMPAYDLSFDAVFSECDHSKSSNQPTCTDSAICSICNAVIPATGHSFTNYVSDNNATCLTNGTKTAKCDNCDETDTIANEGSALGHDIIHHEGKASTCKVNGYAAYDTCSRCDYTTYSELPLGDHTPAAAVKENEVTPTCENTGKYDSVVYCDVCGDVLSRKTITVNPTGHKDTNNDGECETCHKIVDESKHNAYLVSKAKINVKSSATIDYRAGITLTATATGVPDGYVLAVYEGNTLKAKGTNKEVTYAPKDSNGKPIQFKANTTLTVKIIDKNNVVQKDSSGKELTAKCEITVKQGFFDKLIAFFKGLFGSLPMVKI